jgi:hypothetical protein
MQFETWISALAPVVCAFIVGCIVGKKNSANYVYAFMVLAFGIYMLENVSVPPFATLIDRDLIVAHSLLIFLSFFALATGCVMTTDPVEIPSLPVSFVKWLVWSIALYLVVTGGMTYVLGPRNPDETRMQQWITLISTPPWQWIFPIVFLAMGFCFQRLRKGA